MKRFIVFALAAMTGLSAYSITDVYNLTILLHVPQVKDNNQSLGQRVYQTQKIVGLMEVSYNDNDQADVQITSMTNKSFKVNGVPVTYSTYVESSRLNLVGNNATGRFRKPSLNLQIESQPSYVAAYQPTDDNTLVLWFAGKGCCMRRMNGNVTGTLGCGCSDYGHVSPTRVAGVCGPLPIVEDVASVYGKWSATFKKRICD